MHERREQDKQGDGAKNGSESLLLHQELLTILRLKSAREVMTFFATDKIECKVLDGQLCVTVSAKTQAQKALVQRRVDDRVPTWEARDQGDTLLFIFDVPKEQVHVSANDEGVAQVIQIADRVGRKVDGAAS